MVFNATMFLWLFKVMPIYVEHIDDIICNRKKENENDYWLHPFCILVVGGNLVR
jgi:hypothetical protein